jgi:hypothetical protein
MEIISKQVGIAELEWQHQRKQLLEAIDGESCNLLNFNSIWSNTNCRCSVTPADRDAELNRLKALAEKLANKVNAPGDTLEIRLGAVAGRVDEVALHGVRLGTALGLAAMSTRTGVTTPRGRPASTVVRRRTLTTSRPLWSASMARRRHCRLHPPPVCSE